LKTMGRMIPYILRMLVKKPETNLYPAVRPHVEEHFRGALKFDQPKCIGCKICERVCPSDAIEIVRVTEGVPEGQKVYQAFVRMDRCIFCGQCVDSCPKQALENTENFELASTDKKSLRVSI
jgi:formate hydrogenlyase subunit 6/NADH:ubiquinone oxidoreductase subunit I